MVFDHRCVAHDCLCGVAPSYVVGNAASASSQQVTAASPTADDYLRPMPRKQLKVQPAVAREFLKNLRALFVEQCAFKRDEHQRTARQEAAPHGRALASEALCRELKLIPPAIPTPKT